MQNKVTQDKEFRTFCTNQFATRTRQFMSKPKSINELLKSAGKGLSSLALQSAARGTTLKRVCDALPSDLAQAVVSAGLDEGRLTIGVASAAWAARLRYTIDELRAPVAKSLGADVQTIRIRVVPSQA